MSLLVWTEILRLFVNTLNPDDKYSCKMMENVLQPIQMKLSKNKSI